MTTVMIVDDDHFLRKVLERLVTIVGHQVVSQAGNGAEAISNYLQLNPPPEIILMDHRMPIMNGTNATQRLKEINPDVSVIIVSADDSVKDDAIAAGAFTFLLKPIRSADLFSAIETATSPT